MESVVGYGSSWGFRLVTLIDSYTLSVFSNWHLSIYHRLVFSGHIKIIYLKNLVIMMCLKESNVGLRRRTIVNKLEIRFCNFAVLCATLGRGYKH